MKDAIEGVLPLDLFRLDGKDPETDYDWDLDMCIDFYDEIAERVAKKVIQWIERRQRANDLSIETLHQRLLEKSFSDTSQLDSSVFISDSCILSRTSTLDSYAEIIEIGICCDGKFAYDGKVDPDKMKDALLSTMNYLNLHS